MGGSQQTTTFQVSFLSLLVQLSDCKTNPGVGSRARMFRWCWEGGRFGLEMT